MCESSTLLNIMPQIRIVPPRRISSKLGKRARAVAQCLYPCFDFWDDDQGYSIAVCGDARDQVAGESVRRSFISISDVAELHGLPLEECTLDSHVSFDLTMGTATIVKDDMDHVFHVTDLEAETQVCHVADCTLGAATVLRVLEETLLSSAPWLFNTPLTLMSCEQDGFNHWVNY